MHCSGLIVGVFTAVFSLGSEASVAFGDGGTVRLSERRGAYLITVFTSPTPLRAGPVDVSVLLQDADSGRPRTDIPILVRAQFIANAQLFVSGPATAEAATNKLLRAAPVDFPEAGVWHVEVLVQSPDAGPPIEFDVELAAPPPPWREMVCWIGWPAVAIGLFCMHRRLVRKLSGAA